MWGWLYCFAAVAVLSGANGAGAGAARLVCYVESARADSFSECTHLVYAGDARGDKLDSLLKEYRKNNPRLKIILRVAEADKDLRALLKSKHIQGLEIHDAHKSLNRTTVLEKVEQARSALSSSGGGPLFLALPAHPELLAKYYDLRTLMKKVDLLMVETHALGLVKKMTYHPSRLSGLWDMMNTDSVVDLVVGLGVPATKIVISLPATVRQFTLVNETLSTPGSPAVDDEPKVVDQAELCRQLQKGRWTLERDQDLSAPYSFKNNTWMSFEDASSVDVKGKYARVRGLAGIALHNADKDTETPCGPTLRASLSKVLNQQSRAPRAAVLRSLEHEILSAPVHGRALDALQVSPYRIMQVVDSDGVIHSIREDTRTEFSCSRQGYFVHPRSCARFYRCVKFDQLSPEFTVFEFDCPAGLAFDERYEVCVWPGSLPHSQACPGSSEIAPVPKTRFVCPEHEGYYADPENCRWFFACLDHGKAPLTAYEFRCPFGLGFDAAQLKCDWPWLVPACGNIARYEAEAYGYSGATLTGAAGFYGRTADSVNIAAHQSLVSGAALNNLVGIQGGFLSQADALDNNFISSQELANGAFRDHAFQINSALGYDGGHDGHGIAYQALDTSSGLNQGAINVGLVQPTQYNDEGKYTSGSIILDDYRLPSKGKSSTNIKIQNVGIGHDHGASAGLSLGNGQSSGYSADTSGYLTSSFSLGKSGQNVKPQSGSYEDNSGAYIHDPSGDYAEPYRHVGSPVVPYIHDSSLYKDSGDYYDSGKYSVTGHSGFNTEYTESINAGGKYVEDHSGQYVHDNSGAYGESFNNGDGYKSGHSGSYNDYSGGYSGGYSAGYIASKGGYNGGYSIATEGDYKADYSGAYTPDSSGSYIHDDSGKYEGGVYRTDGHIGSYNEGVGKESILQYHDSYSKANADKYLSDSKAYTAGSHTLTAGAVNVELVGKTTLVDANYNDQSNYQRINNHVSFGHKTVHPGYVSLVSQPAVSINHAGTGGNNLDGYSFVTTPTSSGVPTTATPFAVTTSLPIITSYKTTFVPEAPKSTVKQLFGISQPAVTYVKPTVTPVKQVTLNQNQGFNYQFESKDYSSGYKNDQVLNSGTAGYDYSTNYKNSATSQTNAAESEHSGYDYSKPSIKFEDGVTYTTPTPIAVTTYNPHGFANSHQVVHKVASVGFEYSTPTPVREEPFKKLVAYTTGRAIAAYSPTTYKPQVFSHQTIHKVDTTHNEPSNEPGTGYLSSVAYEEPKLVHYTTAQPAIALQPVVSTYQPQVYSHQTLHKVDVSRVNTYSDDKTGSYAHDSSGYTYNTPTNNYEEVKTPQYTTPAPIVSSSYKPVSYSHQTVHKVENYEVPVSSTSLPQVQISYQAPITTYQNPILKYTENVTPVTYTQPSYKTQAFSHQTIHKVESNKIYTPTINTDNVEFVKSIEYEEPKSIYSTSHQIIPTQSVISTYEPQVISHQTLHKVDRAQYKSKSEGVDSGYTYKIPDVKFNTGYSGVQYSTPAPVISTYRPQAYSHQTIHKVESPKTVSVSSTAVPIVQYSYKQSDVSTYENPILKYTQKVTPVTYVQPTATVFTQTYKPIVQQHQVSHVYKHPAQYENQQSYVEQNLQVGQEGYSYNQPEIQRNTESSKAAYSDASIVSHQTVHLTNTKYDHGKDYTVVSTSPSTVIYEDHYADYEPANIETYHAPEYIPPKSDYRQSYIKSTTSKPIVLQSSVVHETQDQYDYRPVEHSQQYETVENIAPVNQIAFSTSHVQQPQKIGSVHSSSFSAATATTKYKQGTYENPEIQVAYKAETYLPPVVSTVAPIVTSTYRPRFYSTTQKYLEPAVDSTYTRHSTTFKNIARPTTQSYQYVEATTPFKASAYLPPVKGHSEKIVNFESFGFSNADLSASSKVNPYQDFSVPKETVHRKPNIVVETVKSHQLGFGTVGPDAGLVSPVTYTTAAPIVVSTTARPLVKFNTQEPRYKYVQSTTEYQAPEYLPPPEESDTVVNIKNYESRDFTSSSDNQYNQYQEHHQVGNAAPKRKNIVVETAKSQLLGFGTVGPDAGLVSPVTYTTAAPVVVSSTDSYSVSPNFVSSTYAPVEQGLFEVTPSNTPIRRIKPKVAVVTKINDFNPFLVRKLGAVCSCQSPVLVLKGKRPTVKQVDYEDYSDNFEVNGEDVNNKWAQKSINVHAPKVVSPVVTSTFNPIIVPDDSFYQDYQEQINQEVVVTPRNELNLQSYVSSTPVSVSSTSKAFRGRSRVKAVTVAPTYKTVLLNEYVTPAISAKDSDSVSITGIDSQGFDRYGPGGLRSREETLQGSVDCKRAGLFRHPKQCNKFYACRWDCTKQRFTLHVFNCPIQLSFDPSLGACNWPSQGPACQGDTLLTNAL